MTRSCLLLPLVNSDNMLSQLFVTLSLVVFTVASPVVVRNSPISLPLARHFNATPGHKIPDIDQARAKALKAAVSPAASNGTGVNPVPVTNSAVIYTAEVSTSFNLL